MSKKSWPIAYRHLLYNMGQGFLDIVFVKNYGLESTEHEIYYYFYKYVVSFIWLLSISEMKNGFFSIYRVKIHRSLNFSLVE